jgi:hypothetical protein
MRSHALTLAFSHLLFSLLCLSLSPPCDVIALSPRLVFKACGR